VTGRAFATRLFGQAPADTVAGYPTFNRVGIVEEFAAWDHVLFDYGLGFV
jgi:hypothetical protein